MFVQLFIALALIAVVNGFAPAARFGARSMQMSMDMQVKKTVTAAIIAASFMNGLPAIAVEGASPKQNFAVFSEATSSPFTFEETREDPIYSPYSPYGSGAAAAYNQRKGTKEEIAFWQDKLATSVKRVDNVPAQAKKSDWQGVNTELTSYAYNLREAMNRLAEVGKSPETSALAAKTYFQDIEDISLQARLKNGEKVLAAYEKSKADLAAFKASL